MVTARTRIIVVFTVVATASIVIGVVAATVGVPESYGYTPAHALTLVTGRTVAATVVWVIFAMGVLAAALVRARVIIRTKPWIRMTLLRGSVWIWAAIATSWFIVLVAWDLPLSELGAEEPHRYGSWTLQLALTWWLASLACAIAGIVWSTALALRPRASF